MNVMTRSAVDVDVEEQSGTFETRPRGGADVAEAHRLACEIERLLAGRPGASSSDGYGPRLARALTRSLIDQLEDMQRSRVA